MNGIIGLSSLLVEETEMTPMQTDTVKMIVSSGKVPDCGSSIWFLLGLFLTTSSRLIMRSIRRAFGGYRE
jgi:hypothetical protein